MPRTQSATRASKTTSTTPTNVLNFWRIMELLTPQGLPQLVKPSDPQRRHQVIAWPSPHPLPWTKPETSQRRYVNKRQLDWQHVVYLGVYDYGDAYDVLHTVFADDPEVYDSFGTSLSACAAVCVSAEGTLLPETAVLSHAAWAIGQVGQHGRDGLSYLDRADDEAEIFIEALAALIDTWSEPRQLTQERLQEVTALAQRHAGFTGHAAHLASAQKARIESTLKGSDTEPTPGFFNSTIVGDIEAAHREYIAGRPGPALAAYLAPQPPVDDRVDVINSPDIVDSAVAPSCLPLGRWPSNPAHHLALSQQFAVNEALGNLAATGGIMGVNGPPGTGKTTMLRDMIAGNVVERARALVALPSPQDGFTEDVHTWKSGDFPRRVTQLAPQLTGFEMVVASANNAAVENVTVEVPGADAIDPRWHPKVDYFARLASRLLAETEPTEGSPGDASQDAPADLAAWGLVAARLGRKAHRASFMSTFWFGRGSANPESFQSWLKDFADSKRQPSSWEAACHDFAAAERTVVRLISEADAASRAPQRCRDLELTVQAAELNLEAAESDLVTARRDFTVAEADHAEAAQAKDRAKALVDGAESELNAHAATRPSFWQSLFNWGARHRWESANLPFRSALSDAQSALRESNLHLANATNLLDDCARHCRAREARCIERREELEACTLELKSARAALAHDIDRFGTAHPLHPSRQDSTTRQLSAPWLTETLDEARANLFIQALHLHRVFFENTAKTLVANLRGAQEVVSGAAPPDLDSEAALAAWQSFFLVVPLVSTTFSSLAGMFSHLGAASLGWLFIDEAGQANPQHAVGGIWRSQCVIAVGDPLQLPPIVSMPPKAQGDIATSCGVSDTWLAPQASVQVLADRVTARGTYLRAGDTGGAADATWVGAPLRVHRRCDDPMFSISNSIAYDGLMVNGVHRSDGPTDPYSPQHPAPLAASHWADEPHPTPGQHLQTDEIARFHRCLNYLFTQGVPATEVIAISPFRVVANALTSVSRSPERVPAPEGADPHAWHQWLGAIRAGTIHTAQGREADVVVLVLGGDPTKPGAKRWAAQSPNLVNVAVSRAKRRLYVIGDVQRWRQYPHFRELADHLDATGRASTPAT